MVEPRLYIKNVFSFTNQYRQHLGSSNIVFDKRTEVSPVLAASISAYSLHRRLDDSNVWWNPCSAASAPSRRYAEAFMGPWLHKGDNSQESHFLKILGFVLTLLTFTETFRSFGYKHWIYLCRFRQPLFSVKWSYFTVFLTGS